MSLQKIISGGQTGADQGALDAAIFCAFPHGGSVPAGRKTEAGTLSEKYGMVELASAHYPVRTEKNVADADGTLVVSNGSLSGGSLLTSKIAQAQGKAWIHIDFKKENSSSALTRALAWVASNHIRILNVAGPRASSDPMIYGLTRRLIIDLLSIATCDNGK